MKKIITYNIDSSNRKITATIIEHFNIEYILKKYGIKLNANMFSILSHKYEKNISDRYEYKDIFMIYHLIVLKFSGISICREGDTFNREYGKKIAKSRAMIKYLKYVKYLFKLKEKNCICNIDSIDQSINSYEKFIKSSKIK